MAARRGLPRLLGQMAEQGDQQDHRHSDAHARECNSASLLKPHHRSPLRRALSSNIRVDRELDSRMSVLNQRRRYRDTALMTLAALSVVVLGELMVHAPSCADGANIPTILIGGAIKVAGC